MREIPEFSKNLQEAPNEIGRSDTSGSNFLSDLYAHDISTYVQNYTNHHVDGGQLPLKLVTQPIVGMKNPLRQMTIMTSNKCLLQVYFFRLFFKFSKVIYVLTSCAKRF